jgi:hypothetical protein
MNDTTETPATAAPLSVNVNITGTPASVTIYHEVAEFIAFDVISHGTEVTLTLDEDDLRRLTSALQMVMRDARDTKAMRDEPRM